MEYESIDGNPVVSHLVRFKDRVTITDEDAQHVRDGAVIIWILRTRCQPPSYHPVEKDSDDRYRFNIQSVQAAAVLHGELREGAIAYLDDPTQGQGRLRFVAPTYPDDEPVDAKDSSVWRETATTFPPHAVDIDTPLPDFPDSAYPPGGTPLEVDLIDEGAVRTAGSIYGDRGSDTQKLLDRWETL